MEVIDISFTSSGMEGHTPRSSTRTTKEDYSGCALFTEEDINMIQARPLTASHSIDRCDNSTTTYHTARSQPPPLVPEVSKRLQLLACELSPQSQSSSHTLRSGNSYEAIVAFSPEGSYDTGLLSPKDKRQDVLAVGREVAIGGVLINEADTPKTKEVQRKLLEDNEDPQEASRRLLRAVAAMDSKSVKLLLHPDSPQPVNVNFQDENGWTALHWSCRFGDVPSLRALLAVSDVSLNAKNQQGWTPLLLATRYNQLEAVHMMIDAKADVNVRDELGITALWKACQLGYSDCVQLLMKHADRANLDANISDYADNNSALLVAAECNSAATSTVLNLLLERHADINHTNNLGQSALWIAARNGNFDAVKLLLSLGADLDLGDRAEGLTAYEVANRQEIKFIIKKTAGGFCPYHLTTRVRNVNRAVFYGQVDRVCPLCKRLSPTDFEGGSDRIYYISHRNLVKHRKKASKRSTSRQTRRESSATFSLLAMTRFGGQLPSRSSDPEDSSNHMSDSIASSYSDALLSNNSSAHQHGCMSRCFGWIGRRSWTKPPSSSDLNWQ